MEKKTVLNELIEYILKHAVSNDDILFYAQSLMPQEREDIMNAYNEGYRDGEMKWIKASERLPEVIDSGENGIGSDTLHLKLKGIPCAGRYIDDWGMTKKCFVIAGFGWYAAPHYNEIEWLDESLCKCAEKDKEIERLKGLLEEMFKADDMSPEMYKHWQNFKTENNL